MSRKAFEIIEKSTENQLKPKKTNGFQRESSKVDRNCANSVKNCGICQNIASGEGQNWNRIVEKIRVGFGRTELSLMLSCTEFCALSSGHGPRGQGFEGGGETIDFLDFLRAAEK